MENTTDQKNNVYKALVVLLIILSIHFVIGMFGGRGHKGGMMGSDSGVITLTGHGEVQAVPDIANIYFSITKDAKTVKEAQDMVVAVETKALDVLKANGIEEKDIKTQHASFSPKYESKPYMPCTQWSCPSNNPTIVGYTSSENLSIKVRNTDAVGKIMQELGTTGVTDLSGPNFSVDDQDALTAQARKEAIDDAKAKAKTLAKDLGVDLGDVVSFSEGGNYPMPMYASKAGMAMDAAVEMAAPRAALPVGENTISSDVTITYKID